MKRTLFVTLVCATFSTLSAQQITPFVANNSGSSFSSASAKLTFSIGEPAITAIGNSNNSITQGFLQPNSNGISLKENAAAVDFSAYPNPVNADLIIRSANYTKAVDIKIIDGLGRTVYSGELKNNTVSMENIPNGIYQLLILNKEQNIIEHKTITKTD